MEAQDYFSVELGDEEFSLFSSVLQSETGIVLRDSKRQLLKNRLRPLLMERGLTKFVDLLQGMHGAESRPQVLAAIIDAVTTNLTHFFREAAHLDFLREREIPGWIRRMEEDPLARVTIWSAGCSTGQEPYSLGMMLRETVPTSLQERFRVVATDIDRLTLEKAKEGIYTEDEVGGLDEARRKTHFVRTLDGRYKVAEPLRELIRFAPLNLVRPDTWGYAYYRYIFCRNVMIYFSPETRLKVLESFKQRLMSGGVLFLGHAEGLQGDDADLGYEGPSIYRLKAA